MRVDAMSKTRPHNPVLGWEELRLGQLSPTGSQPEVPGEKEVPDRAKDGRRASMTSWTTSGSRRSHCPDVELIEDWTAEPSAPPET